MNKFSSHETALDLIGAAAQYFSFDFWITLGAVLIISTVAFIVMCLYAQAIRHKSKRDESKPCEAGSSVEDGMPQCQVPTSGSLEIQTERPGGSRSLEPPRSPTFQHAEA